MKTLTKPDALTQGRAPFEVKAIDEANRTFKGLASTWDLDLGGDVIERGAFKRTLRNWKSSKKPLPLIDQHNYMSVRSVVGKLLEAEETDDGLLSTFEIIEGPDGDEVYRRVKGGYVDGLSIGYRAIESREPDEDQRRAGIWRILKEVKLVEVSVVIWPMNPEATIESVKALTDALKAGTLTPEQEAEIAGLPDEQKDYIRALLAKSEPGPAHEEEGDDFNLRAQEMLDDLRLARLRLGRLATA